jgi:hypothetical protein
MSRYSAAPRFRGNPQLAVQRLPSAWHAVVGKASQVRVCFSGALVQLDGRDTDTGNRCQPASRAGGLTHAAAMRTFGCRGTLSWYEELVSAAASGVAGPKRSRTRHDRNGLATPAGGGQVHPGRVSSLCGLTSGAGLCRGSCRSPAVEAARVAAVLAARLAQSRSTTGGPWQTGAGPRGRSHRPRSARTGRRWRCRTACAAPHRSRSDGRTPGRRSAGHR